MMRVSPAALLARLERFVPRGTDRRSTLGFALFALFTFLVCLLFTYPHDLQLRRWLASIEKESGWKIQSESVTFVPWEGYRLSRVRVSPPGAGDVVWIEGDRLSLRPRLFELVLLRPKTFVFHARAYGGTLKGTWAVGKQTHFDVELSDLSLARADSLRRLVDGEWKGELSGRVRIDAGPDIRSVSGDGKLTLADAAIRGGNVSGFKVPDLAFDRGDAEVSIQDGRAQIQKLTLAGKQIDADVRGDVFLRVPATLSGLNLTVGLRPVPGAAADIENMLLLFNRNQKPASGVYALTLSGTLARPRLR